MKQLTLTLCILLSVFTLKSQTVFENYMDGKIYVKLKQSACKPLMKADARNIPISLLSNLELALQKYQVQRVYRPFAQANDDAILPFVLRIEFNAPEKITAFIAELEKNPAVEYAEKIPLTVTDALPNDYAISTVSVHLAQINASNAWNVFNGTSNIPVAIVDNAVMWTHVDLVQNTYTNTAETPGNGIDDDNNGYIDDVNGYDVTDWDNNPIPFNANMSHGTHCAGIAAGRTDNGIGIASIGWNIKFIPVKCQTNGGSTTVVANGYEGILYAVKAKARVISCSWGSYTSSFTEQAAVTYAWNNGCIIIASAGNDAIPNQNYPAAYSNVYCVAAVSPTDVRSSYSNYGSWVDIAAPGNTILSTMPYTTTPAYQQLSGTSMATPMVAGLAGLMLSMSPHMTASDVLNCISNTAVNINSIPGNTVGTMGAGRIEAYQAMLCAASFSAAPPVANFYAFPPNTCPNTPVQFYDSSLYNPTSYSWVFQGGSPATSTLANPTVSWSTVGTYSVSLTVSNVNGSSSKTKLSYISVAGPQALPFVEGFQNPQFLPAGWTAKNLHNDQIYWERETGIGGFGTSTACAIFDNYNFYAPAEREEMWSPKFNFSTAASVHITFDVAYARFNSNFSDTLEVKVSTNCGQNWTTIYLKGGSNLSTASDQGAYFTPTNSQWRKESVNITTLTAGQGNVMFSFINRGHYGQPIYLDNINLAFPTPTLSIASQSAHCINQSVTHSMTVVSPGNYTWTLPGATPSVITGSNNATTYSATGFYTGTLAAVNGTASQNYTVFQQINGYPTLTVNQPTICSGITTTLSATGGTNYVWMSPTSTVSNVSTLAVNPSTTTSFTITGTNGTANGSCLTTTYTSVFVNPSPTLAINHQTICSGASVTVSASGANSYVWGNGPTTNSFVATPPSSTVYLVIGTTNSCSASGMASVSVLPPVSPSISANSTLICSGDAATLTASGASSYAWFNSTNGSQVTVTPVSTTVYTLTGTTGACTGTAQITTSVIAAPSPSITSAGSTSICAGNAVTLTASGAPQYSWSTGSNQSVLIISPSASTVYLLYGSNAGCTRTTSAPITIVPSTVNISLSSTQSSVCVNNQATLTATGATNYTWSTGSTNSFAVITASATTYYTVQGVTNGCGDKDSVLITAIPYPASIFTLTSPTCFNKCDGEIKALNTQGVGPFTFNLSGTSCTASTCPNLCAGVYTLTVIGSANCSTSNNFTLSQPAALQPITSFSNATCGSCSDGVASVSISGGVGPYTYLWAPVTGTAATLSGIMQGCYTVTVTDANNCSTSSSVCIGSFTGIREANMFPAFTVYPNPANDHLNVKLAEEKFDCYLFNELGQIVRAAEQQSEQTSLMVADLAKGIYYLEVRALNQTVRQKIVVE